MPELSENPWDASELAIKLKVFEGPLDLLVFLIRKNEVDVYDIPMETVTRQYIDYLHQMEALNLEIAGDFFVMASTLMYIKSRMLLPPREQVAEVESEDADEQDPRWELVQQLLEYRRYKDLAGAMHARIEQRHLLVDRVIKQENTPEPMRALAPIDRILLWNTINQIYLRLAEKVNFGQIQDEPVTVAERMELILRKIDEGKPFLFTELFEASSSLVTVVATFLAMLELTRLRRLQLQQEACFDPITCIPIALESKNA
jgi:segregation and condensation protein A